MIITNSRLETINNTHYDGKPCLSRHLTLADVLALATQDKNYNEKEFNYDN